MENTDRTTMGLVKMNYNVGITRMTILCYNLTCSAELLNNKSTRGIMKNFELEVRIKYPYFEKHRKCYLK